MLSLKRWRDQPIPRNQFPCKHGPCIRIGGPPITRCLPLARHGAAAI
jgi:hypothetical protein